MGFFVMWLTDIAVPPFSSMSIFDSIIPSMFIVSLKFFACSVQSFPVIDSPTNIFRSGFDILMIFFISSSRFLFECSRPAVSISTACVFVDFACFIASYATAAGSAP